MSLYDRRNYPDPYGREEETDRERKERLFGENQGKKDKTGFHHSNTYHKFFEGYTETKTENSKGKHGHIVREYTGRGYVLKCSDREWILRKILYAFLAAASCVCFVFSQLRTAASANAKGAVFIGVVVLAAFAFLFYELISFLMTGRLLTIDDFTRSRKWFVITSAVVCVAQFASAIAIVITGIAAGNVGTYVVLSITAFICSVILFLLLKTEKYDQTDGKAEE